MDVDLLSQVGGAMATHRTLILRKPVDRAFVISVIDGVILPACGIRPALTQTTCATIGASASR